MSRSHKLKIVSFCLVLFCAFFVFLFSASRVEAIDYTKNVSNKVNVNVQVNDGLTYFSDPNAIKVEVDASLNTDVTMFSIVICHANTNECSLLDAKYRYTDLENGLKTVENISLNWIVENNKNFVVQEGTYIVKIKPEYKKCTFIFCTPIMDIITDEEYENRYITTNIEYKPLANSDVHVQYNGVDLSNNAPAVLELPRMNLVVSRFNQIYQEEVTSANYRYCLADNNWSTNWSNNNCRSANINYEEGIGLIDLSSYDLEGNYVITVYVNTSKNRMVSVSVKFIYDKVAPRVSISDVDSSPAKSKTFNITISDSSATKTRYLVKKVNEKEPTLAEFKTFATSNSITIDELTGVFNLYVCVEDSTGNITIVKSMDFELDNAAPIINDISSYIDFLNKKLIIQVKRVTDQTKENLRYFVSLDGLNYQEFTSNLIKMNIKDLMEETIVASVYVKDNLGNGDESNKITVEPEFEEEKVSLTIENSNENNYYNEKVTFVIEGVNTISIKVNSFEYINNRYFCPVFYDEEGIFAGYKCSFSNDGVYTVKVTDINDDYATLSFVIDKDKNWKIDNEEVAIEEIFLMNVTSSQGKYYASIPLYAFDLTKDLKVVYSQANKYYHLGLLEEKEVISLTEIEDPTSFIIPIDIASFQKASYSNEEGEYYFLAYSVKSNRVDNNVVVDSPNIEDPSEEEPNNNHPVGNITTTSDKFSLKDVFTFKNVLTVAIIVVVVIYVIRFFKYKKNIQTV